MRDNAFGVICVIAKESKLQPGSFFSSALAAAKFLEFHKYRNPVKPKKFKRIIYFPTSQVKLKALLLKCDKETISSSVKSNSIQIRASRFQQENGR